MKSKQERKLLADRIEDMMSGSSNLFISKEKPHIESYAKEFYNKIVKQKLLDCSKPEHQSTDNQIADFQEVDINTFTTEEAKNIGSEWLVYQAVKQLEIDKMLTEQGYDQKQLKTAVAHIIARCAYPASEHKTALWMNENSGLLALPGFESLKINKNHLYTILR